MLLNMKLISMSLSKFFLLKSFLRIPLPGELTGGVPARFDRYGVLFQPKRIFKKKVSPQCMFCDKRYRNEHSLKKHIAKKHEEYAEWVQCLKCFKPVSSKEEIPNHLCEMVIF
jgi:hypothetical protein